MINFKRIYWRGRTAGQHLVRGFLGGGGRTSVLDLRFFSVAFCKDSLKIAGARSTISDTGQV